MRLVMIGSFNMCQEQQPLSVLFPGLWTRLVSLRDDAQPEWLNIISACDVILFSLH